MALWPEVPEQVRDGDDLLVACAWSFELVKLCLIEDGALL